MHHSLYIILQSVCANMHEYYNMYFTHDLVKLAYEQLYIVYMQL